MKIKDFLSPSDVAIDVQASDKPGLLKELAGRAAWAVSLPADVVVSKIERRDELGSTGLGGGISIPHARFRDIKKPFGLLVRLKQPLQPLSSRPSLKWPYGCYVVLAAIAGICGTVYCSGMCSKSMP